MKKRLPTAEERRLWRESNRFTTVKDPVVAENAADNETDFETAKSCGENAPSSKGRNTAQSHSMAIPSALTTKALVPLSTREAAKRFKAYREVEATLDLHGMTQLEAYEKLQQFLRRAQRAGKRHVIVITGKGRGGVIGVLRKNLPDWLNAADLRPLIAAFAEARPEKGGAGVTHVLLKRLS